MLRWLLLSEKSQRYALWLVKIDQGRPASKKGGAWQDTPSNLCGNVRSEEMEAMSKLIQNRCACVYFPNNDHRPFYWVQFFRIKIMVYTSLMVHVWFVPVNFSMLLLFFPHLNIRLVCEGSEAKNRDLISEAFFFLFSLHLLFFFFL